MKRFPRIGAALKSVAVFVGAVTLAVAAILGIGFLSGLLHLPRTQAPVVAKAHFDVDVFALMTVQYRTPTTVVGVNLYGPSAQAVKCRFGRLAYLAQAPQYMPKTDRASATCIEVRFRGPAPGGQTAMQPGASHAVQFAMVPIEYDVHGRYIGMGVGPAPHLAIPGGATAAECKSRADDLRKTNYAAGRVPRGATLIVYCVGIPPLPPVAWASKAPDSQVRMQPCPYAPFPGDGPCQTATMLWLERL